MCFATGSEYFLCPLSEGNFSPDDINWKKVVRNLNDFVLLLSWTVFPVHIRELTFQRECFFFSFSVQQPPTTRCLNGKCDLFKILRLKYVSLRLFHCSWPSYTHLAVKQITCLNQHNPQCCSARLMKKALRNRLIVHTEAHFVFVMTTRVWQQF